ncbi:MAG TPA: 3-phosphoshikimate 1-carboxyvinyltransferase, partial [bacterium]|nr:3-phosphoshikimate 1-carboxyvinyltransferase [bacterium]
MLPERLTLPHLERFSGKLVLPGSKSLSNRILLLAALASGETRVTHLLHSEDVRVMLEALRLLGVPVRGEPGANHMVIVGQAGPLPSPGQAARQSSYTLHLANAGTAMRPLTAVLCAGRGSFTLQGVPRMHERPIGDLVEGLRQLGARITCLERDGYPPLQIEAAGLAGGPVRISGATSSQFLSALLLAAPLARAPVDIAVTD